jgi:hypothetical protein
MQSQEIGTQEQNEHEKEHIYAQDKQQPHIAKIPLINNKPDDKAYDQINCAKRKFQRHHFAEVLAKQLCMLGNVTVVELRKPEIEKDAKKERKLEQRVILPVRKVTHMALNLGFNDKGPERLD